MIKCPICGRFPVIKNTGFCVYHHKRYVKDCKIFKKNWIETQKINLKD